MCSSSSAAGRWRRSVCPSVRLSVCQSASRSLLQSQRVWYFVCFHEKTMSDNFNLLIFRSLVLLTQCFFFKVNFCFCLCSVFSAAVCVPAAAAAAAAAAATPAEAPPLLCCIHCRSVNSLCFLSLFREDASLRLLNRIMNLQPVNKPPRNDKKIPKTSFVTSQREPITLINLVFHCKRNKHSVFCRFLEK